jgi:hypothetical protein
VSRVIAADADLGGLLSPLSDVPTDMFFTELRQRGITVQREEGDW